MPKRNAVPIEMPTARSPAHTNAPRTSPQTKDVNPGLNAGGRGTSDILATNPRDQKNSPSGWRFRPLHRPTFRFRVQSPGGVSTYLRSLLGASRTLGRVTAACKQAFILIYA